MAKCVLIVDDDPEMLQALAQGLAPHEASFSVLTAESGPKALALLKKQPVSLLITDLKMPGMDGFELLGQVMEYYPDIPVVIMTGYSTPEMKRLAKRGGAIGYIAKPFLTETLARKILSTLSRESEGGTLHGVSSGIFLQLIEMEERTCTIRLGERGQDKQGVLFFKDGELLDARYGNIQGLAAALEIFSWDNVSIAIQNGCPRNEKKIEEDLQALLLEAMRRKDENPAPEEGLDAPQEDEADEDVDFAVQIRRLIEEELGDRSGMKSIYLDEKWNASFAVLDSFSRSLGGGVLKLAYIDEGGDSPLLLLAHDPVLVAEVDRKNPRDRLIQILNRLLV
jgi:CheY-like chemotaxis protein